MNNKPFYMPLTSTPFRSNESYMEINPCKELSSYIRCYWGTKRPIVEVENDNKVDIVIPDTCVDIIYHIDYTDKLIEGGFCGINDHSFELNHRENTDHLVETFAIRFYAWSAYEFAEDSLKSTMNGYFTVESRFKWLDKIFRQNIFQLKTLQQKVLFIEQQLLKRLSHVRVNQIVNDTVQNILINKGTLDISDVARESFVSTRQLERLFQEYIGVSPKRLSNLIRYQFLWNDILYEANFDVLNAVYKYGYTDQSHLLREFKRYHSMDIYSAKAIALKNVGNIQDDRRNIS